MAGLDNEIRQKGIAGWVNASIRYRKAVYAVLAVLVAVGVTGLVKMNKDEFPTFVIKQGLVAGIYPGASAAQVEEQLTRPLQDILFSFREVDRGSCYSVSKDGICYIYVDLNCSQAKKDEVWSKIKLRLQTAQATLPLGVLGVAVLDDFSNTSSILLAMESPDKGYVELQDLADRLCSRLRRLPNLAQVKVVGGQSEEIAVTVDRERLSAYGISPTQLLLSYQTSSLRLPAGRFETDYVSAPIHVQSGVDGEREVAEKIVWSDPDGNVVRLRDVAAVERRMKRPEQFVAYNGDACLILDITMRPDHNIVSFGREVDAELAAFSAELPESVRLVKVSDMPAVVKESVSSFLVDLLISMLVVIAVMLLLFPIRSALIAGSGVPVITAVTLGVMYATGIDLNTVTLAALIVVLGMVVDDSIITMDGYMDKLHRGMSRHEAALASARELFVPIFTATLAISLMFFPCKYIIKGYLGDFVAYFPWVVLVALMTSILYAVTVVPSLETKFIGPEKPARPGPFDRLQNVLFRGIDRLYERVQGWCFRHPAITLGGGVAAIGLGVLMFLQVNIQMMPMAARDYFVVELEVQNGAGIDRTKALTDSLQSVLLAHPDIESCTAFMGTGAPRFSATYSPILPSSSVSQLIVKTTSNRATENYLKTEAPRLEHIFPDALLRFKQMNYQGVAAPVAVTFKGPEREVLIPLADSLKAFMGTMSAELQWIHSDADNWQPTVELLMDDDEATRLGISKSMLALSVAASFSGQTLATLYQDGRSLPVNLYSHDVGSDMDFSVIQNQMLPTAVPGISVPLRQVARVQPGWQLIQYVELEGFPQMMVMADLRSGQSQPPAMKKVKDYVETHLRPILPEGVKVEYGGLSAMNVEVVPQIVWSFVAAVAVLLAFLIFHFKKLSVALLTMAMSLLCLFGASFGLWVFNLDLGLTAVLGLISLVGIIMRNGILMYEYAEEQRFVYGVDVRTASMEAGKRRMTPIFLTSCTTALGVLPMVLRGDLLWQPMGVTICLGVVLSIALIVLIMPVAYWQLFKNQPTVPPLCTQAENEKE